MIRARGAKKWEIVVYAGRDPITGRERRQSRTFHGTKTGARDEEREMLRRLRIDEAPAEITFDDLADRWLDVARLEASTRRNTESYLNRHIRPRLGHVQVAQIRADDLDRFYLDLEKRADLAPSTVVRIHGIIRAALEQAVTWEWIARNPARRASPPALVDADPDAPDVDDILAVLAQAYTDDQEMHAYLRLIAATGVRPGSACGVHVVDVDFAAHLVRHHRAIARSKGAGVYEKTTKSGGRHPIALDRRTIATLRWHLWRMRNRARELDTVLVADPYVFSRAVDGSTPWAPDHVAKRYRRLADRAGVALELRQWRHFQATLLLAAGVNVRTVSGRLTHARTSTTLDRYQRHVPASDRDAAGIVGNALKR